jgi:pyridoxine kinase
MRRETSTERTMPTERTKNVLSIQSNVSFGHVGNAAAAFPLQRLGFEVWRINTVQFSNHTGYGGWRGRVFSPEHVAELVEGLAERGVLGTCDAVLSGYVGDAALGEVVLDAVAKVKAANPEALYLCDPVIGDTGRGIYVDPGVPAFMKAQALRRADVLTPNLFELEILGDTRVRDHSEAIATARRLIRSGPETVLVTSLRLPDTDPDSIEMLAITAEGAWLVATPFFTLDPAPNGAGDTVAALFLAYLLKRLTPPEALAQVAGAIYAVMGATAEAGSRELQLIAAQARMASPPRLFPVRRLS